MKRPCGLCILLALYLGLAVKVNATWVSLGTTVNEAPQFGETPSLIMAQSKYGTDAPFIAYEQYNSNPDRFGFVKFWNGNIWEQVGTDLRTDRSSTCWFWKPSIIGKDQNSLYVAYEEYNADALVFVKKFNGTDWEAQGNTLSVDTSTESYYPKIGVDTAGSHYVAWDENYDDAIFIKKWSGSNWQVLGTSLTAVGGLDYPRPSLMIGPGDVPHVAWDDGGIMRINTWNGTAWVAKEAGIVNPTFPSGEMPDLAYDPSAGMFLAYVAFDVSHDYIRVMHLNGTNWENLGTTVDASTYNTTRNLSHPHIAIAGDLSLYISWNKNDGLGGPNLLYSKHWNGNAWISLGTILNVSPAGDVKDSAITTWNNLPVVTWFEGDTTTSENNVYVKQWQIINPTPTPQIPPGLQSSGVEAAAYPLPASTQVTFAYNTRATGNVDIKVYNARFRLIKELTGTTSTGQGTIPWDVSSVAPGIYFYEITVNGQKLPKKKLVIAR